MNSIEKVCNIVTSSFKKRFSSRAKIINEMIALDEIKEIFLLSSIIATEHRSRNIDIDDNFNIDDDSELSNAIKAKMLEKKSAFSVNLYSSFNNIDLKSKNAVINGAKSNLKYKPQKEDVRALAISGAGGKGQFYVGVIKQLEKENVLKNIEIFSGTSAGALTAIPLSMGFNAEELEREVRNTDFRVFMIEGRSYSTTEKRIKRNLSYQVKEKEKEKDILVSDMINNIKVLVEEEKNLYEKRAMFKDGLHSNLEDKKVTGEVINFMGIELKDPIIMEFSEGSFSDNLSLLWNDPNIVKECESKVQEINDKSGSQIFINGKDLLKVGLSFAYKMDYVEFYFGKITYERIRTFVEEYGEEKLRSIVPSMETSGDWSNLSLKDLGLLARSKEGHDFGFRDLAIGVTKTSNKVNDIDSPKKSSDFFSVDCKVSKSNYISGGVDGLIDSIYSKFKGFSESVNQIFGTKGIMVSSDPENYGDEDLASAPLKEIARMSMSIPFEFSPKAFNGSYYVDGGLHNNLPSKYFDDKVKERLDKRVLCLVPLTASETEGGSTVEDCFYSPGAFSPSRQEGFNGWFSLSALSCIGKEISDHAFGYLSKGIITMNNLAYKEMGLHESFRTIIINTMNYGTMSFHSSEEDFENLNNDAERSVSGSSLSDGGKQAGIFDPEYSSYVRLLEQKISVYKKEKGDVYLEAKKEYESMKNGKSQNDSFSISKKGDKLLTRMFYNESTL